MVSDGEDVSANSYCVAWAGHLQPARLVPVPEGWLKVAAGLLAKADIAQRLCGSLQVDISKTRELLGWMSPLTLNKRLAQAAL